MDGAPTDYWGKLERDGEGAVRAWHPLVDHCADVAACCEALLTRTLLGQRLARLGGLEELSSAQVARLCVLAALHDVGKFNARFQAKARSREAKGGHGREAMQLFSDAGSKVVERFWRVMPEDEFWAWDGGTGATCELLIAAISHHGRPLRNESAPGEDVWPLEGADAPWNAIADLVQRTREWFPAAYTSAAEPLPSGAKFQHAFAGVVMLADWLGSDREYFDYSKPGDGDRMAVARPAAERALNAIGMDPSRARALLGPTPPTFDRILAGRSPNPAQAAVLELPLDPRGSIAVLESETGSGKTEAALAHYLRLFHAGQVDGLYFALPTRTAATQIHRRVHDAVTRAFPDEAARPPVVLAVPGYLTVDGARGVPLPHFRVLWNDDPRDAARHRGWAAEHPKRYLAGAVVVGTVDQVLLSTLTVPHAHLRASALLRHLLVVDEVHASDAYMTRLLQDILCAHRDAGGHALLLSATLGTGALARLFGLRDNLPALQDACLRPYPAVTFRGHSESCERVVDVTKDPRWTSRERKDRPVRIEIEKAIDQPDAIAARALDAAVRGLAVLVLRNTVRACVATQRAVEALARQRGQQAHLFHCEGVPAPHHARFAKEDREALDAAIERALGKERESGAGCVVVATQTVQQSLDIDADLLITDLCPMDVLLQRLGRLWRHTRPRPDAADVARAVVLVPDADDLGVLINEKSGNARGAHGFGTVYDDLRIVQATLDELRARAGCGIVIPRDNRELVERTTHCAALAELVRMRGGPWPAHARRCDGVTTAQRLVAEVALIDRGKRFGDYAFPAQEIAPWVKTRLGEGDRIADFKRALPGPFGRPVTCLTVPAWLVEDAADDAAPEGVVFGQGRIAFDFGARRYVYDRLGLRVDEDGEGGEAE